MWFSIAFAGLQILGTPEFRGPDGIVDAAVAEDGTAWVLSEHGLIVGFDRQGAVVNELQACESRSGHTRFELEPRGTRLGIDCGEAYRVLELPGGRQLFELPVQTQAALLRPDQIAVVGETFTDGVSDGTAVHVFDRDGRPQRTIEGEFVDLVWSQGLVLLERRYDEDDAFLGWGLTRVLSGLEQMPLSWEGDGDRPPAVAAAGGTVCLSQGTQGVCQDVDGNPRPFERSMRPFVSPEQGVPVCNTDGSLCYDVDRIKLRPVGADPGIGRIEAFAASRTGASFLTRDHNDLLIHHSDKGRRPLAETDGAFAISPSGRYAWYQTARRSIRVELINGVRTVFPRATAAVFDDEDQLYLALPSGAEATLIAMVPKRFDGPLPLLHVFDPREVTGLQLARRDGRETMLVSFGQDDAYALLDVRSRSWGEGEKKERKPFHDYAFSPLTPLWLDGQRGVVRVVETEAGVRVMLGDDVLAEVELPAFVRLGPLGGFVVRDTIVESLYGKRRMYAELPGPVHEVWVGEDTVFIALRDGRLGILK